MPRLPTTPDGLRAPENLDSPDIPRDFGYLADDTQKALLKRGTSFASAASRASAITAPTEGLTSYLRDVNSAEIYTGTAWVPMPMAAGVQINAALTTAPPEYPTLNKIPFTTTAQSWGRSLGTVASGSLTFSLGGLYQVGLYLAIVVPGDSVKVSLSTIVRVNTGTAIYPRMLWISNSTYNRIVISLYGLASNATVDEIMPANAMFSTSVSSCSGVASFAFLAP